MIAVRRQPLSGGLWSGGRIDDLARQILEVDATIVAHDLRPLHRVNQLAYIAWPRVCLQRSLCCRIDLPLVSQDAIDQQRNVPTAISQRRQSERHDVDSV